MILESIKSNRNVTIIQASILDLSVAELNEYVKGCNAIASCLGHNMSIQGIFGKPRKLVTDATKRLCSAINEGEPKSTVKYILMNTVGNRNRDLPEKISICKGIVVVDEQTPSGNLSACVFEGFSSQNYFPKIISKSLPEKYVFENGGRNYLLKKFGLSCH